MNIFLVRHAQSQSNVDLQILKMQANMAVNLSDLGLEQAKETGNYLSERFKDKNSDGYGLPIKVWNSPYNRTRQTSKIIKEQLTINGVDFEEEESIYITEREFGLVDNVEGYHTHEMFTHEANHYSLHKKTKHDYFVRPPLGESPFDMCIRLDFFLKVVLKQEECIKNHVVVSHGAAIRGLIMMHQKQKFEEYTCPNPANASVRHLVGKEYKGEIFKPTQATY
jgi:broad specificity phosphatase PhoE